ncbi:MULTISPECIES: hypothetical protein [Ruminococcus]|jgi:hypothetical protein|uniref:Uncharacterized protein n=1 Tax=Ruminococcus callidus ATCC 27760 TaxID=411473 RepID=U2LE15_9FIRM|nr:MULTISPECIES: hypothetical protein [Ruminococcus]ERJ87714.1 hypothetical protein RUMCAL_03249 [Ruminococcus callidus ATCC 27760]MDY3655699.1 hypothetical protein [Ruminococcus callidus]MEE0506722.1 hypothetical protein [Ruminococcus callidus]HJH92586.1 hypothetical protein [Oscillospiraceae bacterium]
MKKILFMTIQSAAIWTAMAMLLYTVGKMHMDSSLFLPLTAGVLR